MLAELLTEWPRKLEAATLSGEADARLDQDEKASGQRAGQIRPVRTDLAVCFAVHRMKTVGSKQMALQGLATGKSNAAAALGHHGAS